MLVTARLISGAQLPEQASVPQTSILGSADGVVC